MATELLSEARFLPMRKLARRRALLLGKHIFLRSEEWDTRSRRRSSKISGNFPKFASLSYFCPLGCRFLALARVSYVGSDVESFQLPAISFQLQLAFFCARDRSGGLQNACSLTTQFSGSRLGLSYAGHDDKAASFQLSASSLRFVWGTAGSRRWVRIVGGAFSWN